MSRKRRETWKGEKEKQKRKENKAKRGINKDGKRRKRREG